MASRVLVPPGYVQVDGRPHRPSVGTRPVDRADWLEVDADRAADLLAKDELLRTRPAEVVAELPVADAAARETLDLLVAHLTDRHPALHSRAGDRLTDRATGLVTDLAALRPIDAAGRLVQEDLCVMVRDSGQGGRGEASWVLGAASLCFPNRWRLADKLGRPMVAVHGPVPEYAERLAVATDRLFDRLAADRPVGRLNWGVLDRPELFQPDPGVQPDPEDPPPAADVGSRLYFRVERQTLRLLPKSGGVLFTIRTYVSPLGALVDARPALAADLAATVRALPPPQVAYRGWTAVRAPMLAWLDARSANVA